MHSASQLEPPAIPSASAPRQHAGFAAFIAADVGGTHARLGLIEADVAGKPVIAHYAQFTCAEYASLSEILRDFLRELGTRDAPHACIACAGYVFGDRLINANLAWQVSLSALQRDAGLRSLALVNDFKAVAYAAHFLNEADMTAIAGDGAIQPGLPRLVVGPGTGLGAAVLIPATPHVRVLTSEGGHAALAARNALELEIVRRLGHGVEHVLNERVLSGPGLLTLYRVLGAIRGTPTPLQTPAQVSTAALAGNDLLARECIEVFCAWLGSLVGDLVMLFGAYGGVYLAGGVLPQILPLLERSEFVSRLKAKGALTDVLARVPVRLIEHGQLGVRGAAHWFVDHELKADESLHESK